MGLVQHVFLILLIKKKLFLDQNYLQKIYKLKKSLKIMNVGRLVDQKNQIIILKAVKNLIQQKTGRIDFNW